MACRLFSFPYRTYFATYFVNCCTDKAAVSFHSKVIKANRPDDAISFLSAFNFPVLWVYWVRSQSVPRRFRCAHPIFKFAGLAIDRLIYFRIFFSHGLIEAV